jgi:hypothetical protein
MSKGKKMPVFIGIRKKKPIVAHVPDEVDDPIENGVERLAPLDQRIKAREIEQVPSTG